MKKPSINLILNSFSKANNQDNQQLFEQNLQQIFEKSIQNNVQRIFIRALLDYLKKNQTQINLKQFQDFGIAKIWKNFQFYELKDFIEIFQQQDQITENDLKNYFQNFIKKKKFEDAFQFYQALNLNQNYFVYLVEQMSNNNEANKAAEFINKLNFDPANYPKIVE